MNDDFNVFDAYFEHIPTKVLENMYHDAYYDPYTCDNCPLAYKIPSFMIAGHTFDDLIICTPYMQLVEKCDQQAECPIIGDAIIEEYEDRMYGKWDEEEDYEFEKAYR